MLASALAPVATIIVRPAAVLASAMLAALLQAPPALLDAVDTLLRLSTLALLVIPVTEVRRLFGGLPAIPLPGGKSIAPGRWFSWVVAVGVQAFGHLVGWLAPIDFSDPRAAFAFEVSVMAVVANVVYEKWWRGQIGLPGEALPTP